MPEATPRLVKWPSLTRSITAQAMPAAAAARNVFMKAWMAVPLAAKAEPALKPNHPNHRMPVPIMTSGIECGGCPSRGQPLRLPSTSTAASAAMPALTWITVPPAKSSEPRSPSQPVSPRPTRRRRSRTRPGSRRAATQIGTNTAHAANFMRSATAPEISAGVMTANMPRKATASSVFPPSPSADR